MDALFASPAGALREVILSPGADAAGFRAAVRALVAEGLPPERVIWSTGAPGLFDAPPMAPHAAPAFSLPRAVTELIGLVLCHGDPERHGLLYRLIWRTVKDERALIDNPADPLVHRLMRMAKAVRRDIHKMHAFVRFRSAGMVQGRERFLAWFEPEHFIVEAVAGFFVKRFPAMDWSILTPHGSLSWDGTSLVIGPPALRPALPEGDGFEEGWLSYYESTFNPARTNTAMMTKEMPKKYWANLPEAKLIPGLVQSAASRVDAMIAREASAPRKRDPRKAVEAMSEQAPGTLEELNRLMRDTPPFVTGGTRAVLGEGPAGAPLALVGEQPGDQEDVEGRPFVGPAGRLLMKALGEAGLSREQLYLTNAVKHFKYVQRGKRRLHQSPTSGEVKHYRWWLKQELDFVQPRLVVALGASAALALAGHPVSVTRARGPMKFEGRPGYVTTHPSYLLRLPDPAAQNAAYAQFVADLKAAAERAAG
ncbi:UdgX family uracil-DNA binding protein [Ancylobacter sp. A5.8]|uniref:UdgX family uracil-DNA binding protein n=1 Tax=Ancylobacter gelatini TaxID=2919920 RepID=UPI001F4E75A7|nr:UdgX family uracil-DNA binding protein [Ancylobacter gelatini]MCJ8142433.1 UdgX family uracil-DNA binding protein [Ancylobacter gelatini]